MSAFTAWVEKLSEAKFVAVDGALRLVLAARGPDLARTRRLADPQEAWVYHVDI